MPNLTLTNRRFANILVDVSRGNNSLCDTNAPFVTGRYIARDGSIVVPASGGFSTVCWRREDPEGSGVMGGWSTTTVNNNDEFFDL
jgi:hypothetical protein